MSEISSQSEWSEFDEIETKYITSGKPTDRESYVKKADTQLVEEACEKRQNG